MNKLKPNEADMHKFKTIKCNHCNTIMGYERFTCSDCKHHFLNPFDQMYCSLPNHSAKRVCSEFVLSGNRVESR